MSSIYTLLIRSLFFILVWFGLLASCAQKNNEPVVVNEQPVLVSTLPANNARVNPDTETVQFFFDRTVVIVDKNKITLNNSPAPDVSASSNTITVGVGRLNENASYTVNLAVSSIKAFPGAMNQQAFTLSFTTEEREEIPIINTLVVQNPTPEALKVYKFLRDNYGSKIISGATANVSWNTNEADWVFRHTNIYPAMNCFDYIHLYASPANWIDYEQTEVVEDWWNNNGLVSILWHWNVPTAQGSTSYAFYTNGTNFDASRAVQTGTYEHGIVVADINKVADYLLLLKQKNIPVIWRPLHEAAGRWFWWGAKGPAACKALWQLMFNIFEEKGLNNLIWVWTSESNDEDWFPGHNYVDIIGRDLYNRPAAAAMYNEYTTSRNVYPNYIISLSECGNVAGITEQWNAGCRWSWFAPWYDYNRTNNPNSAAFNSTEHIYANINYWQNAFANPNVITRDQMPSLK